MKVLVLTGSPHRHGSTDLLANEFIRGAEKAGHKVTRFDAAFSAIRPCLGCDGCRESGVCVQKDDMAAVLRALLEADLVALVTPLYYYGISAQLKAVIDRFYAKDAAIHEKHHKAVLLCAAAATDDWTMEALECHFKIVCRYLNWKDCGKVLAEGCGSVELTKASQYPQKAYELGLGL